MFESELHYLSTRKLQEELRRLEKEQSDTYNVWVVEDTEKPFSGECSGSECKVTLQARGIANTLLKRCRREPTRLEIVKEVLREKAEMWQGKNRGEK